MKNRAWRGTAASLCLKTKIFLSTQQVARDADMGAESAKCCNSSLQPKVLLLHVKKACAPCGESAHQARAREGSVAAVCLQKLTESRRLSRAMASERCCTSSMCGACCMACCITVELYRCRKSAFSVTDRRPK